MINKLYSQFFDELNKHKVEWCLIKDYEYLVKHGYDNEVDLVTEGKNRDEIRKIGRNLGWYESPLNKWNTHVIFFKFIDGKPYRIDIHINKALATAVPWLKAKDILSKREKKGNVFYVSPDYELAILMMAGLRGRKPKKYRIERIKKLKSHIGDSKEVLRSNLSGEEVETYCREILEERRIKLSAFKRLGITGIIKNYVLYVPLFFSRLFSEVKYVVASQSTANKLEEELGKAKMSVKKINTMFLYPFVKGFYDVIILESKSEKETSTRNLIQLLFP